MVRFQPQGCSIWVVSCEGAPPGGRFSYELDERGEPCNPQLHLAPDVTRAKAFALALEHEQRWRSIRESVAQRKAKEEQERLRAEEATGRWDEIRRQWEETKRRVRKRKAAEEVFRPE